MHVFELVILHFLEIFPTLENVLKEFLWFVIFVEMHFVNRALVITTFLFKNEFWSLELEILSFDLILESVLVFFQKELLKLGPVNFLTWSEYFHDSF